MRRIFEAAGAEVVALPVRIDHPVRFRDLARLDLPALALGRVVPESFAWSRVDACRAIEAVRPSVIIATTARAYHPSFHQFGPVVLDFVDRLSASYRDRAKTIGPFGSLGFRSLALPANRFECIDHGEGTETTAAGWQDALALGATWVPNVVDPAAPTSASPDVDCVFFGNLAYPPNAAAVADLALMWPSIQRMRPGTTLMVAGRNLSPQIRATAERLGWLAEPDFSSLDTLLSRARLAVAPLRHASGIQNKVLEAAAHGLAQVVTPAAARGLDPEFPLEIATTSEEFARTVCELLDTPERRLGIGEHSRRHVTNIYRPETFASWASTIFIS